MDAASRAFYHSPIGWIRLEAEDGALSGLDFVESRGPAARRPLPVLAEAGRQLAAYFRGDRRSFDLPLRLRGTEFQRAVWEALLEIPFGAVSAYGEIAAAIGRPGAVRAVGAANGANPVSIIVPCHRVVGADGRLTGYGGGLWRKEWLLRHEGGLKPLF